MNKASSSSAAAKDEWVMAAMTDNQIVAELLLRLKQAKTTTAAAAENPDVLIPPSGWSVRRRRSRSSRFSGLVVVAGCSVKKETDSIRGSPITPLSWSGGGGSASPSSADGFEGTTSPQASCSTSATASGSKALLANEISSSFSNRSKKKKMFSELKHEENFLLKERLDLEKEIASMRTNIMEQSARNSNLKRFKLHLNSDCARREGDIISKSNLEQACDPTSSRKHETCLVKGEAISDSCRAGKAFFLLPDLNMASAEDDACTETLYGMS